MRPQRPEDANVMARVPINTREIGKMRQRMPNSHNKENPDQKISPLWERKTTNKYNNGHQRAPRDNGTDNPASTRRITTEISNGMRSHGDRMADHVLSARMSAKIINDETLIKIIKELVHPMSTIITVGVRTISEIMHGITTITIARDLAADKIQ